MKSSHLSWGCDLSPCTQALELGLGKPGATALRTSRSSALDRMQQENFCSCQTHPGVQLKSREVSCWNKSHGSCCSFSAKSEAVNNGRGFAGNGNKKQWTLLCQMLPKPFHAFKRQGINDIYWRSTNQGINGLLQRPGLNTLRGILGLLLFLPRHSAWVRINPGKPSHSSLPSLT